ncbi:FAD-binding oxidoreductase [Micromonospora sp. NBC_01655]|uniref:NAD(P)/FAD-dependent oxidoreductase n=1 Tax=Micromonospora sp. NBC_01655 TaxID=2975983 RepID=UPI002259C434|nr:FAD-dependent oxidoreductase [Micromonospora sp. NBC_01655]MCX4472695.1 FAD-binding oxidoreductase [Micromonospora sp. NBC_01655]
MSATGADVVVIGAGMVGAACAYYAARAGLAVTVVDRAGVAGGTTGAGEGNILLSDKPPGPELALARHSGRLWHELGDALGGERIELERKGGLVVAASAAEHAALRAFAAGQRAAGVEVVPVPAEALPEHEPHLARDLAGGAYYPQDMQVQPMLAAAHLLRAAGVPVLTGTTVTGLRRDAAGAIRGVVTDRGALPTPAVVNAAGVWAAGIAGLAGVGLPVLPRRGFVLVTEALPPLIRHKVYAAGYVAGVGRSSEGLEVSPVVEGTRAGTVLIGSTRERVGFDRTVPLSALRQLAAGAVRLFPVLASVSVIRAYRGFRPYSPDHLPMIGADPRVPGLFHACGHEGAGIGLAPATGHAVAALLTGRAPQVDLRPFAPERHDVHI